MSVTDALLFHFLFLLHNITACGDKLRLNPVIARWLIEIRIILNHVRPLSISLAQQTTRALAIMILMVRRKKAGV